VDLNVNSVLDDVTSGGREFHVRDAPTGKARSPTALINSQRCVNLEQWLQQFSLVLTWEPGPTWI